jgi:tetratricopeptide (TPR) repeat protein
MKKICQATSLAFMLILMFMSVAIAQTPQQVLTQYLSDLQKNPNDTALREKIIRHAQTMRPVPAIPKEAERFMTRGAMAMKSAKDVNDFKDSVVEFEEATLSAPWLANAYYNLGLAQDKAGLYADAIKNLKLYLLAAPNAADVNSVEKLIYEIEYRQEKAARAMSPQAVAANKQNTFEELLKKINGRRYFYPLPGQDGYAMTIDISGKLLLLGLIVPPGHANRSGPGGFISYANRPDGHYEIRGRETTVTIPYSQQPPFKEWAVEITYIISENGDRITERRLFNTGKVGNDMIYFWRKSLSE